MLTGKEKPSLVGGDETNPAAAWKNEDIGGTDFQRKRGWDELNPLENEDIGGTCGWDDLNPLDKKWCQRYEELVAFQQQHGHSLVPLSHPSLGSWVGKQRTNFTRNTLQQDRKDLLEELGFVWNARSANEDSQWYEKYARLEKFQIKHGHCAVPQLYKEDMVLGNWVNTQRSNNTQRLAVPIRRDRKVLLDKLGFIWDARIWHDDNSTSSTHDEKWNEQYGKLIDFKRKHGHTLVPHPYKEDMSLGNWVSMQRTRPTRRPSRKTLLDKLGFIWDERSCHDGNSTCHVHDQKWNQQYDKLADFHREHGHCVVPSSYNADKALWRWVRKQRYSLTIRPDRQVLLDQLGFAVKGCR
jgi:hypothetical protein